MTRPRPGRYAQVTTPDFQPTLIEIPADFPVKWAHPADVNQSFRQDRQHAPCAISPFSGWLGEYYLSKGATFGVSASASFTITRAVQVL